MDYSLSIGFAQSGDDLTSIAKLRYRVFHEQFGANGKSFDHFKKSEWESYDENCEHILCKAIFPNRSEEIIGTFRCKISTIRDEKFRVQKEFNIDELLKQNQRICELGRICVDARFRNGIIIFKIWQFLFNFLKENDVEILIGVASFEGSNLKLHEESLHILFKNHVSLLTSKIKTEQENKCAKCGTECKLELDHIQKISRDPFNRNGRDNLVGLCQECHRDKTIKL